MCSCCGKCGARCAWHYDTPRYCACSPVAVSAPDMVSVIAAALAGHERKRGIRNAAIHCTCGWAESIVGMRSSKGSFTAHQARVALAAISEAGAVEWALQQKTFIDGGFDQTYTSDGIYSRPFTEDQAKNHSWLDPRSSVPARVVSHITGPWTEVEAWAEQSHQEAWLTAVPEPASGLTLTNDL